MGPSTTSILENNGTSDEIAVSKAHGYDSLGQPIEAGNHLLSLDKYGGMAKFRAHRPLVYRQEYGLTIPESQREGDYANLFQMEEPIYVDISNQNSEVNLGCDNKAIITVRQSQTGADNYEVEITNKSGDMQHMTVEPNLFTLTNINGKEYAVVISQQNKGQVAFVRFTLKDGNPSPVEIRKPQNRLESMDQVFNSLIEQYPWLTPQDALDLTELTPELQSTSNKYIQAISDEIIQLKDNPSVEDLIKLENLYGLWGDNASDLNDYEIAYLAISDYAELVELMHTISGVELQGSSPLSRQELAFKTLARVEMEAAKRRLEVEKQELKLFGRSRTRELQTETIERFNKNDIGSGILGLCSTLDNPKINPYRRVITIYGNHPIYTLSSKSVKEKVAFLAYMINHERQHINIPLSSERGPIRSIQHREVEPKPTPINPFEELFTEYITNNLPVELSRDKDANKRYALQEGSWYQHRIHTEKSGEKSLRGGGASDLGRIIHRAKHNLHFHKEKRPHSHLGRPITAEDVDASVLYTAHSRNLYGDGTFMGRKVIGFASLYNLVEHRSRVSLAFPLRTFEEELDGCKDEDYQLYSASINTVTTPSSYTELLKYLSSQFQTV